MLDGSAFVGLNPEKTEVVHRELQVFLEEMLRQTATWPTATDREMKDFTHLLLGSALDVGARSLAAACLRLERALSSGNGIPERATRLVEEMRRLLSWLEAVRDPAR